MLVSQVTAEAQGLFLVWLVYEACKPQNNFPFTGLFYKILKDFVYSIN